MRKYLFIALISLIFLPLKVNAASFSTSFGGNNSFNTSGTISLIVSNFQGFDPAYGNKLFWLQGTLQYDSSKINITGVNSSSMGLNSSNGNTYQFKNDGGVNSGATAFTVSYSNRALGDGQSTTISFVGVTGTDNTNDAAGSSASKTITRVVPVVAPKTPTTPTTPTPEVPAVEEPVISSNNNLQSLSLSKGKINFSKDFLFYDIIVDEDVDSIKITATAEDSKAKVTGTGTKELKIGTNTFQIKVKAEDGTVKTYTLNIAREGTIITNTNDFSPLKAVLGVVIGIMVGGVIPSLLWYSRFKKLNPDL